MDLNRTANPVYPDDIKTFFILICTKALALKRDLNVSSPQITAKSGNFYKQQLSPIIFPGNTKAFSATVLLFRQELQKLSFFRIVDLPS